MPLSVENLPRDPDALIEIVIELRCEIEHMHKLLKTYQGMVFGSRSEKASVVLDEQERLDLSFSLAQQFDELGQLNTEGIGSQLTGTQRESRTPFDASEMPYVVVNQEPAVEFENCTGVGAGMPV